MFSRRHVYMGPVTGGPQVSMCGTKTRAAEPKHRWKGRYVLACAPCVATLIEDRNVRATALAEATAHLDRAIDFGNEVATASTRLRDAVDWAHNHATGNPEGDPEKRREARGMDVRFYGDIDPQDVVNTMRKGRGRRG